VKNFEKTLKEKIQFIEKEIPKTLENNFLNALEKISPDEPLEKPKLISKYRIAAIAAMLLLVVLYILFPLITNKNNLQIAREILVQSASLEGKPAETFIFREKNPDITIIWIDKDNQGAI